MHYFELGFPIRPNSQVIQVVDRVISSSSSRYRLPISLSNGPNYFVYEAGCGDGATRTRNPKSFCGRVYSLWRLPFSLNFRFLIVRHKVWEGDSHTRELPPRIYSLRCCRVGARASSCKSQIFFWKRKLLLILKRYIKVISGFEIFWPLPKRHTTYKSQIGRASCRERVLFAV